ATPHLPPPPPPLTGIASAMRSDLSPQAGRGEEAYDSIFTYSKSPGLLSMPTFGGEIQEANWPISVTGFIREAMKSPSFVDGSQSSLRLAQVASSIRMPSGVACTSLNSPMWRWEGAGGRLRLEA